MSPHNRDIGIGSRQNDPNDHIVKDFVAFHNSRGIMHGSYGNRYHYPDGLLFGNGRDVHHKALSNSGNGIRFTNLDLETIYIGKHVLGKDLPNSYRNVLLRDGVTVEEGNREPGMFEFRYDCDQADRLLSPGNFDLITPQSVINVINECSDDIITVTGRDGTPIGKTFLPATV